MVFPHKNYQRVIHHFIKIGREAHLRGAPLRGVWQPRMGESRPCGEVRCHVETLKDGIMGNLWENMGNMGNLWQNYDWLVVWNIWIDVSTYWEFHHPKWRTHIFQKGRYTSKQLCLFHVYYAYLASDGMVLVHQLLSRKRLSHQRMWCSEMWCRTTPHHPAWHAAASAKVRPWWSTLLEAGPAISDRLMAGVAPAESVRYSEVTASERKSS